MSIYYVRPIIREGHRTYRVYDNGGQVMTDEPTREAALVYISEITHSEADVVITTLGGIFSVQSTRDDYDGPTVA